MTTDHVMPKSLGGTNPMTANTVKACRQCNEAKGNLHPKEWGRMVHPNAIGRYVQKLKEIFPVTAWLEIDHWHTDLMEPKKNG